MAGSARSGTVAWRPAAPKGAEVGEAVAAPILGEGGPGVPLAGVTVPPGESTAPLLPAPPLRRATQVGTRPFRFGSEAHAPDPDPPLPAGTTVGDRYRIVALLGEGGMGRVYEAVHVVLERRVALKLLRKDARAQPDTVARFRQEALAASRVGHPNIVEVVDFASLPDGQVFMVMELLEGESLEEWMSREGRLDRAIPLLIGLAEGLDAAHRAGVIHRDIKPANVFLLGNGGVKILDFGIAKMTHRAVDGFETQAGSVLGTPYYLAPERIMGAPLTAQADLYSVGVILYELLTGTVPFVAESFMAILARHVKATPLDPRQAAPERGIPDGIAGLTMRLLEKEPSARPSDAGELCRLLRELQLREGDGLARVVTGPRELGAVAQESTVLLDSASVQTATRDTAAPGLAPRGPAGRGLPIVTRSPAAVTSFERAPGLAAAPRVPVPARADAAGPPGAARPRSHAWVVPVVALLGVVAGLAWARPWEEDAPIDPAPTAAPATAAGVAGEPDARSDARAEDNGGRPAIGVTAVGAGASTSVGARGSDDPALPVAGDTDGAAAAAASEAERRGAPAREDAARSRKSKRKRDAPVAGDASSAGDEREQPTPQPKPKEDGPTIKDDVYDE